MRRTSQLRFRPRSVQQLRILWDKAVGFFGSLRRSSSISGSESTEYSTEAGYQLLPEEIWNEFDELEAAMGHELARQELLKRHWKYAATLSAYFRDLDRDFGGVDGNRQDSKALPDKFLPGQRIGNYELVRFIAQGAFGLVFHARREDDLRRDVALKIAISVDAADLHRFVREKRILARLQHESICQVFDAGTTPDGHDYMVMELIDGEWITHYCQRHDANFHDDARLLVSICQALATIHAEKIIHRDLKPSNLLVSRRGVPKICDFGIAKTFDDTTVFTKTGRPVGTLKYMSPEQLRQEPPTPATDIYALGTILFELLTGQVPFDFRDETRTILAIANDEPSRAKLRHRQVPFDLATICLKCLDKRPLFRYQSALELKDDLERFCDNRPILARRVSTVERMWRWCQRNTGLAILSTALVAVATLGLVSVFIAGSRAFAFQNASEDFLRKLASTLSESNFLDPSAYPMESDFRVSFAEELESIARITLESRGENTQNRVLYATLKAHIGDVYCRRGDKTQGLKYYKDSLASWRRALHEATPSDADLRAMALTADLYASRTGLGVGHLQDLEGGDLFPGFQYANPADHVIADVLAQHWLARAAAFAKSNNYAPCFDAAATSTIIWTKLTEAVPKNTRYLRSLASAKLSEAKWRENHADKFVREEKSTQTAKGTWMEHHVTIAPESYNANYAAAYDCYQLSRMLFLKLDALETLSLDELRELTAATQGTARLMVHHADFDLQRGIDHCYEAVSYAEKCQLSAVDPLPDMRAQIDTLWECLQAMRPDTPDDVRRMMLIKCRDAIDKLADRKNELPEYVGRLAALNVMLCHLHHRAGDQEAAKLALTEAKSLLEIAVANDHASPDLWQTMYAKCLLQLGELHSQATPGESREYFASAQEAAVSYLELQKYGAQCLEIMAQATKRIQELSKTDISNADILNSRSPEAIVNNASDNQVNDE